MGILTPEGNPAMELELRWVRNPNYFNGLSWIPRLSRIELKTAN